MLQVFLVLMTAYGTAAMGQLFFFHVVLIRKVINRKRHLLEKLDAYNIVLLSLSQTVDSLYVYFSSLVSLLLVAGNENI